MKQYNYFGDEQKIYYEKLANGLDVYVIPNHKIKGYHAEYVVRYGSVVNRFKPICEDKSVSIPLGTAHFLEHKLFEMEDSDAFDFFSKSGTYSNAATTYNNTRYYIDGEKLFAKNFDFLTTMMFTPVFTEENIHKELGIIEEEIKMYNDMPEWKLELSERECLTKTPYKDFVAGSVTSIKKINDKLLFKIYETFYQPSNMFLIVSGNVSFKKVLEVLKNNDSFQNKKSNYPIVYKKYHDTKKVVQEYRKIYANITVPKLKYAYKFALKDFSLQNKTFLKVYLNMIFSCLFGNGSDFEEEIIQGKIASYFFIEHNCWDDIYVLSIQAESEYADLFVEKVNETLDKIAITEEDFERIKKVWCSIAIRNIDDNTVIADDLVEDLLYDNEIYDNLEFINHLDFHELLKVIQQLDLKNKTFVLMLPEDK